MASAGVKTKFYISTDILQYKADNEKQLIAKKRKKNSTTETETRGLFSHGQWSSNGFATIVRRTLCIVTSANVQVRQLAGNTEYVNDSTKFKKENIGAHGKSQKHAKCCDWDLSKTKHVQDSEIAKQFVAIEKKDEEKATQKLKMKFNREYRIGKKELPFTKVRPLLIL